MSAFERLAMASLDYLREILPELPVEAREKAARALDAGGRLMTTISAGDGAAVALTLVEGDGTTHSLHVHVAEVRETV